MVVGVTDHHIENHLPVKPMETLIRLSGNVLDLFCQVPVSGMVISISLEEGLHTDQMIAGTGFIDIETEKICTKRAPVNGVC